MFITYIVEKKIFSYFIKVNIMVHNLNFYKYFKLVTLNIQK